MVQRYCPALLSIFIFAVLTASTVEAQTSWRPSLRVGGFTDVVVHTASEQLRGGVDLADLDIYAIGGLTERWSVLAEGIAENYWKMEPNEARDFEVELDRFYLQYERTDEFRLEIGETQTGIIRWNERERRSRFLQTPIDVPAIARQGEEHGAWPMRFVGVWASGRSRGPLGLAYGAGAGAGAIRTRDEIPLTSGEQSPAVFFTLSSAPERVRGLEIGVAAYAQHLHALPQEYRERDVTLSASYVKEGTEVRAEWATMDHRAAESHRTYSTHGYYALVSKRLSGSLHRARPYLLFDRLNLAEGDAYLEEARPENAIAGGVRYDLTQRFTVKGEYRSQRAVDGRRERFFGLQMGLSF